MSGSDEPSETDREEPPATERDATRERGGEGVSANGREIVSERVHAERSGDGVVFIVGMRINSFWAVHRWVPILLAAPRLVRGLEAEPGSALLGSWTFVSPPRTIGFVQYWESVDALRTYARDADRGHVDAWRTYAERAGEGAVGIWHETYPFEDYETLYDGVPPRGLGAAAGSELVSATGAFETAADRLDSGGDADEGARGEDA